ncbi:hypothetical protein [Methanobrevibacter sp.]|uniref:hypothetical protein n=1 Tax=Methanobrevibacter sp. TaxID=66852 RepID=UPI0038902651
MTRMNDKKILDKSNGLKKVNHNQIKSQSDVYEIYLGTFIDNTFTWYSVKKIKNLSEAYKEFKSYVNTQLKYTDEELQQVWDTGRLDIELRQGSKLLNWVGIYSREVKPLDKKEEKEVEKGDIKNKEAKNKSKKDSVDVSKARLKFLSDSVNFDKVLLNTHYDSHDEVVIKTLQGKTKCLNVYGTCEDDLEIVE